MDDLERCVVVMAGAHLFVTAEQLGSHFGLETDQLTNCLSRLRARGWLREERLTAAGEPLFRVTQAGLVQAGSRLEAPKFRLHDVRGQLAAVWLWMAGVRGDIGEMARVLSAREMAGLDQLAARSVAVPCGFLLSVDGVSAYPDLGLVTSSGNRIAMHLMLWPYSPSVLDALICAYERQLEPVDAAMVFVSSHEVRLEVSERMERSPLAERLHVRVAVTGETRLPSG